MRIVVLLLASCAPLWSQGQIVCWSGHVAPAKLQKVADLTGAEDHWTGYYAIATLKDGTITGWGSAANYALAKLPRGLSGVAAVAGGRNFCLALLGNGKVVGWGGGDGAQAAEVPVGLEDVQAIAAGGYHGLALKIDGTVAAWGSNYEGQCDVPEGLRDVVAIAAGVSMSGALRRDGTVVCWGTGLDGTPVEPPAWLSSATSLVAGDGNFFALQNNGQAVTWGANWMGETIDLDSDLPPFVEMAAGINEALGLSKNGRISAFYAYHPLPRRPAAKVRVVGPQFYGLSRSGQLEAGGPNVRQLALHGRSRAKMVSAGHWHSTAIFANDRVKIVGERRYVDGRPQRYPKKARGVEKVVSGRNFDVGLMVNGTVEVAGFVDDEQPPEELADVVDVDAGNSHAIALKSDGTVVTWGDATHIGERLEAPAELQDPATARIKAIAATAFYCLALQEGGKLFKWGGPSWDASFEAPGELPDNVVDLEGGERHVLALTSAGTVLAFGENGAGQTDLPDDLGEVTAISAGGHNSLALKKDGTVVAWGAERSVPPGLTDVTAISCGPYHCMALVGTSPVRSRK